VALPSPTIFFPSLVTAVRNKVFRDFDTDLWCHSRCSAGVNVSCLFTIKRVCICVTLHAFLACVKCAMREDPVATRLWNSFSGTPCRFFRDPCDSGKLADAYLWFSRKFKENGHADNIMHSDEGYHRCNAREYFRLTSRSEWKSCKIWETAKVIKGFKANGFFD